jgi:hypothetical protein
MTPKQLAEELNSDPKMVRKFLRSNSPDRANKGGRWEIDSTDLDAIKAAFAGWKGGRTTRFVLADSDSE